MDVYTFYIERVELEWNKRKKNAAAAAAAEAEATTNEKILHEKIT